MALRDTAKGSYIDFLENENKERIYPVGITDGIFLSSGKKLTAFNKEAVRAVSDIGVSKTITIRPNDWSDGIQMLGLTGYYSATKIGILPESMYNNFMDEDLLYDFPNMKMNELSEIYKFTTGNIVSVLANVYMNYMQYMPGTLFLLYDGKGNPPLCEIYIRVTSVKGKLSSYNNKSNEYYNDISDNIANYIVDGKAEAFI